MDELIINPQASDTGAMGHISNITPPVWFQEGRKAMLQRIAPEGWPLLVVRYEVELLRQMFPGARVTIRSAVENIGNSSLRVVQEAWQHDQLAATGIAVLVNFDYLNQRSQPFTDEERERLTTLRVVGDADSD